MDNVTMSFSDALRRLRDVNDATVGIHRVGWNGVGMFVCLQQGYPQGIAINKNTAEATGLPEGSNHVFRPYLMFCTADSQFVPWVASQSDLLTDDWKILVTGPPVVDSMSAAGIIPNVSGGVIS